MPMTSPQPAPDHPVSSKGSSILDRDVACPECGYNLRGLSQAIVDCPECGVRCDVAKLLTRRWDQPWYKAPAYNRVCLPGGCLLIGLILQFLLLAAAAFTDSGRVPAELLLRTVLLALTLVVWAALMVFVYRTMAGAASVGFAMLAHVPVFGYIMGLVIGFSGVLVIVNTFYEPGHNRQLGDFGIGAALLVGAVGLIVAGRWSEKAVAGHCIRLYLRHRIK